VQVLTIPSSEQKTQAYGGFDNDLLWLRWLPDVNGILFCGGAAVGAEQTDAGRAAVDSE